MKNSKPLLMIIVIFALLTAFAVVSSAADYCAVGEIKDDKAAILKADGTVETVTFEGEVPTADTVCSYVNNDGKYTFTAVSFPDYASWRIYDVNGGAVFADGSGNMGSYASAVAFLKTGTFKWKVATTNQVVIPAGVGDFDNTGWPSNIYANWNGDLGAFDVMYGPDYKAYNAENGYPGGLDPKTVMCPDASENELRVTGSDPEPTPGPETPDNNQTELCAVGEIDAENKKAAVLFKDGSIQTVDYEGEVTADTICAFTVSGGKYTFTPVSLVDYASWRVYDVAGGAIFYGHDGTNEYRIPYGNSTAFLKTGTHKWKVATANQVVIPAGVGDYDNTGWPSNMSAADLDGDGALDVLFADGTSTYEQGLDPKAVLASGSAAFEVVLGANHNADTADVMIPAAFVALISFGGLALLKGKKQRIGR